MSRQLTNWLDSYQEYTRNTESAAMFHKWVGISMIASALRRKVWFNFGRIKVHPNLFVVLVAEPGLARKTQAISFGEEIISEISAITLSADAITPQALLEDLEASARTDVMPDASSFTHCSLTISSGEFESFIGGKKDNDRMIVLLTDLFDCKHRPYRYRTKHAGSNEIHSPYLNLLGATTPGSIANSLPVTAIGGGLTSRIIFIWAEGKEKKVDVPEIDTSTLKLKEDLVKDISVIARMAGEYSFSKSSRKWWHDFYMSYDERDPNRICKDPVFTGWYSRKPIFLIKIALILSAAATNSHEIHTKYFEQALEVIKEAEIKMVRTFAAVGRSEITSDTDTVRNIIRLNSIMAEDKLFQLVWRDIDAKKFENVIETLIRSGEVHRLYELPSGDKGIWYQWKET